MYKKHLVGQVCETLLCEWLTRRGYYVFLPRMLSGPADVVAIKDDGTILLFDSKREAERTNPNRSKPCRIYRKRSDVQKKLGVRMAYVNPDTREIHVLPALDVV